MEEEPEPKIDPHRFEIGELASGGANKDVETENVTSLKIPLTFKTPNSASNDKIHWNQTCWSSLLLVVGIALRIGFFFFGLYQDKHMQVKYTDIDYLVFTDAAKYTYEGQSPYLRETYRYTPLLAWMLIPTAWGGYWVHFGKVVFMLCDILTGVLVMRTLRVSSEKKKFVLLAIWLLNPMVITISTRGSSESVLTLFIMLAVKCLLENRLTASALWLGLSIHFKIYPIIYLPTFVLFLVPKAAPLFYADVPVANWINKRNLQFVLVTVGTVVACNFLMFCIYGFDFLYHSYLYHLTRVDHRHNFSVYNVALYYKSARTLYETGARLAVMMWVDALTRDIEKIAFVPQLVLSAVILPVFLARKNIMSCLFIQTFAFVTFNKVITSQYFIWFLIFLPHYLSTSRLATQKFAYKGVTMLGAWVVTQGLWLYFAYKLEFKGESTFNIGLFFSSVIFFLTNCWMLGEFIEKV